MRYFIESGGLSDVILGDAPRSEGFSAGDLYTERWPEGTPRVCGRLYDGVREGVWTRWFKHGERAEVTTYRKGRLHGPTTSWYPTGQTRAELHYEGGRLHGPYATWHPNGRMAEEGEWIDGLPHRDFARFWPTGKRRLAGSFEHGRPVGAWKVYSQHGVLVYRGTWDHALLDWLPPWLRLAVEAVAVGRPVLVSFQ